jgi:Tfp pilus assembly protein FimT
VHWVTRKPARLRGFSMIELVIVLAIAMVVLGMSIPAIRGTLTNLRHRGAVTATTTAIQSTRFLALRDGMRYAIVFSTNGTYQVSREPVPAGGFVNVGTVMPLGSAITVDQTTRLEFSPNGTITATAGALNFQVIYTGGGTSASHVVTVSRVGHVTVQ